MRPISGPRSSFDLKRPRSCALWRLREAAFPSPCRHRGFLRRETQPTMLARHRRRPAWRPAFAPLVALQGKHAGALESSNAHRQASAPANEVTRTLAVRRLIVPGHALANCWTTPTARPILAISIRAAFDLSYKRRAVIGRSYPPHSPLLSRASAALSLHSRRFCLLPVCLSLLLHLDLRCTARESLRLAHAASSTYI